MREKFISETKKKEKKAGSLITCADVTLLALAGIAQQLYRPRQKSREPIDTTGNFKTTCSLQLDLQAIRPF
jgi:hypothetical protein